MKDHELGELLLELGINTDITSRLAVFAFAKAFTEKESAPYFAAIEKFLLETYGDVDELRLMDLYKDSINMLQRGEEVEEGRMV